jgi:hypothetical protein
MTMRHVMIYMIPSSVYDRASAAPATGRRTATGSARTTDVTKPPNDDDVYIDKLQTRGIKKSILYM